MKNSLWEIRQKVKAGEPLTDDEKEALRVLELGLREVTKELMTSEIKKELRRALSAYKGKKRQWNTQKEVFRRETGYDFEFEEVFDFLITNTSTGSITLGEFLGLSNTEVNKLFDLWSVLYPDYRKKQREAIRRELSTIAPPVATSTEAKEPKKKQKKALDELAKLLSEPNVVVEWAIKKAAIKAGYSNDNVWKLYGKVRRGELNHKQLTVIMTSKNELD